MKTYTGNNIKNAALCGHSSKGKTTLAEAMLYISGATERMGSVLDGTTVTDFDAEEKKRKISVSNSLAPIEYNGKKINIIDTPGLFDFAEGAAEGIHAAETAIIVVSARSGLAVGAEKAFRAASKRAAAKIFVATKMDHERADFYKCLNGIVTKFGTSVCPVVVPVIKNGKVDAYYNMIDGKAYAYDGIAAHEVTPEPDDAARFEAVKSVFAEAVAGTDDEIMEKYFDGDELTTDDKIKGLTIGVKDGSVIPVFALSGLNGNAVDLLMKFIAEICPSAGEVYGIDSNNEPVSLMPDENAPLAANCFKTVADPFIGKLSFFKVVSGTMKSGMNVFNPANGKEEKLGKIVTVRGAKQEEAASVSAGDICAVAKLNSFATGSTMCTKEFPVTLDSVSSPLPSYSMAVKPTKKGDEEKISSGLLKLCEEDPSLKFETNNETHQQILSGLGEQHLDVAISKLKTKYGVDALLETPKVAYRETITKKVSAQGRHKKQSGGHGQFGDVFIEFEPNALEEDLVFDERVVGGAVPKNFFPAVEKGLKECMAKGVLAGYPMVNVKATLFDGSYHPVDSSEMSFKMAASLAYKAGIPDAMPVILEPIVTLRAICNDDAMGDIIGDINKRRGRVLGMNPTADSMQEIIAEVPQGEMTTFSTAMRQITQGRGSFSTEFARYEKVPEHIAQKIIEESKSEE